MNDLHLIDADALKDLIRGEIDRGLRCGDNVINSGYPKAMYLVLEYIDKLPMLDLETTLKGEYQNGYWNGYNDAMARARKERNNEID